MLEGVVGFCVCQLVNWGKKVIRRSSPPTINSETVPSYGGGTNSTAVSELAASMEFWGWYGNTARSLVQAEKASTDSPKFLSKGPPVQQSISAFTRQKDGPMSSGLGS